MNKLLMIEKLYQRIINKTIMADFIELILTFLFIIHELG